MSEEGNQVRRLGDVERQAEAITQGDPGGEPEVFDLVMRSVLGVRLSDDVVVHRLVDEGKFPEDYEATEVRDANGRLRHRNWYPRVPLTYGEAVAQVAEVSDGKNTFSNVPNSDESGTPEAQ